MTTPVLPSLTPYERLLAEAIPVRPDAPRYGAWTDAERDAHWQALCKAVGVPDSPRPTMKKETAA